MKNKGFSLIELIGVILILGLLLLVLFPAILETTRKVNEQNNNSVEKMIISASKDYVSSNANDFSKKEGNIYCIEISELINASFLNEDIFNDDTEYKSSYSVKVKYESGSYDYEIKDSCIPQIN